jgi:hypothetical protein
MFGRMFGRTRIVCHRACRGGSIVRCAVASVMVGGLLAMPLQAQALEVGGVTVTAEAPSSPTTGSTSLKVSSTALPTVSVEAPSLPVSTPTTPTASIATPSLAIKTPTVSTQPIAPIETPSLTVEASAPKAVTSPSPAPTVKAPTASLEVSVGVTSGPSAGAAPSSAPSAAPPAGPTGAGSSAASALAGHAAKALAPTGFRRGARSASLRFVPVPNVSGRRDATGSQAGLSFAALTRDPFGAPGLVPTSYLQVPPADTGAAGPSSSTKLFGMNLGPAARDSLILALLIFGTGAFMLGLLFADGLGLGPRHPLWRRRFAIGLRRRLHWSPSATAAIRPFRRRM